MGAVWHDGGRPSGTTVGPSGTAVACGSQEQRSRDEINSWASRSARHVHGANHERPGGGRRDPQIDGGHRGTQWSAGLRRVGLRQRGVCRRPAGPAQPGLGYLFDVTTGDKVYTLVPSRQANDSLFGFNSKIYGNQLLVGDPANPFGRPPRPGAAYVFDVTTGTERMRLQPEDSYGGDEFGFGINLFENLAIVGAPNLGTGIGAAYLFDLATGDQLHRLLALDPLAGSEFGADVAVNSDYAIVGAPANFDTLGFYPGAAYVFDVQTGDQRFKLEPEDGFGGDEFGFDVAVSGNLAVIGAPNGGSDIGAAYLFDLTSGEQLFKLQPDDIRAQSDFGSTVDIFGNLVAIGASGLSTVAGSVYLFDATTGTQLDKVSPSDLEAGDAFGISVSLFEQRLFVGSPRDDDTNLNAGAAYLFDLSLINPPLAGDFNGDRVLDAGDIDLLTLAVVNSSSDLIFDVSGDGTVGPEDRVVWVNDLFGSFFGDANLDLEFNTDDLVQVLQFGEYEDAFEDNSTWIEGDFDGDLDFGTEDLVLALQEGAYEMGPAAAVRSVPEPASGLLLLTLGPWLGRLRRRRAWPSHDRVRAAR